MATETSPNQNNDLHHSESVVLTCIRKWWMALNAHSNVHRACPQHNRADVVLGNFMMTLLRNDRKLRQPFRLLRNSPEITSGFN